MNARVAVFAIFLFLLAGCADSDGTVRIQFWNFGGTPNYMEWVRARVDSFNVTHPGIRVVRSQKSWNLIRELLFTNFSAGTGPDVMTAHANYAAEFGEAGYYYPINNFPDFEEVKAWFLPGVFEATRYNGNYYGLPASALVFVLVCNKDLFDAAGLDPPKTWSAFRDAARQLTRDTDGDGSIDQWGLVLQGGDKGGFSYRLAPFIYKAGGDILSEDLKEVRLNAPEAVAAVQLFADMYQIDRSITPGFLAYTLSEVNDLFSSNRVAMSIEGPWFRSMVADKSPGKDFYTVPVPVPDERRDLYDVAPSLQDMVMFPINAATEHPDEAWQLVKYLRGEEADRFWATHDLGGLPTTQKVLASAEAAGIMDLPVYMNELKHARPWPAHPRIISIARNVIAPYGQKAIVGELSPPEAMRLAAAEAQKIIDGK